MHVCFLSPGELIFTSHWSLSLCGPGLQGDFWSTASSREFAVVVHLALKSLFWLEWGVRGSFICLFSLPLLLLFQHLNVLVWNPFTITLQNCLTSYKWDKHALRRARTNWWATPNLTWAVLKSSRECQHLLLQPFYLDISTLAFVDLPYHAACLLPWAPFGVHSCLSGFKLSWVGHSSY